MRQKSFMNAVLANKILRCSCGVRTASTDYEYRVCVWSGRKYSALDCLSKYYKFPVSGIDLSAVEMATLPTKSSLEKSTLLLIHTFSVLSLQLKKLR